METYSSPQAHFKKEVKRFSFKNDNYLLHYESVNIIESCLIDSESYAENNYSTFKEWKNILGNLNFILYKNDELFFDSSKDNPFSLNFSICQIVVDFIKDELFTTAEEINQFTKDCENFLNGRSTKMPPELLIAENIYLEKVKLSLSDLESLSTKKYEKINVALTLLKQKMNQ